MSVLKEKGTFERVIQAWEGKKVFSTPEHNRMVLSLGQVVLVYMFMGTAVLTSIIILVGEHVWTAIKKLDPTIKTFGPTNFAPTVIEKQVTYMSRNNFDLDEISNPF